MKAMIFRKYGSPEVLEYSEIPKPVPNDNEVLIKIRAASVMPGDCEIRRFDIHVLFWPFVRVIMGIFRPKVSRQVLGMELSGEVVEVGSNVIKHKKGDQVICSTGLNFGAYAQYTCLPESTPMTSKPGNVSNEEAATIPVGGTNALHYMRQADIKPGDKVLIIGAAGCFGTYAVQLAKMWGANVTGVDSTNKLSLLADLGADHTIDYTHEDFALNGPQYDVIFDVIGRRVGHNMSKALKPNGKYILATPWVSAVIQGLWCKWTSKKKFIFNLASENTKDLDYLKELVEAEKIKPIIDRTYNLEELAHAHHYVEKKIKKGHVAITIPQ